jgi:hypothetical protein
MARISPDPSRTAMDFQLISFENPTEVRTFEKGRFERYNVGPTTLGRATYEPGWKWSEHVGPGTPTVRWPTGAARSRSSTRRTSVRSI